MSPRLRHRRVAAVAVIAIVVAGACGLPVDERVQPFDDVPFDLTATSTTTTTTLPPPEPAATTTVPPAELITTTTLVRTEATDIFFVLRGSGELQRVTVSLPAPVSRQLLINQLESVPDGTGDTLRTSVASGLLRDFTVDRGVASVELSSAALNRLSSLQQRRAIAQVVLTLSLFTTPEGGIGQVILNADGEPLSVFVPSRGASSEPGEALAYSDFAVLISGTPPTTTTSPPPVTSPTVPDSTAAPTTTADISTTTETSTPRPPDSTTTATSPTATTSTTPPPGTADTE